MFEKKIEVIEFKLPIVFLSISFSGKIQSIGQNLPVDYRKRSGCFT